MSPRFDGKVIVVMGAGAAPGPGWGNGRATSIAFAKAGALVVAVDLNQEAADETQRIIESDGGRCVALRADVTNSEGVEAAVQSARELTGRIDVLHNNVGMAMGRSGDVEKTSERSFDREMAVTAKSAFLCMRAVLPIMSAQGSGVITNTSSVLAIRFIEQPSFTYSAAKAAVEAMTRSVAASHGPKGIRTNCLRIGYMDTPINRAGWQSQLGGSEAYEAGITSAARVVPMRRMGTGLDTAAAAVFLASDDASYLNGVILPVDGGVEHTPVIIPDVSIAHG